MTRSLLNAAAKWSGVSPSVVCALMAAPASDYRTDRGGRVIPGGKVEWRYALTIAYRGKAYRFQDPLDDTRLLVELARQMKRCSEVVIRRHRIPRRPR